MVVHVWNLTPWEAEAEGLRVKANQGYVDPVSKQKQNFKKPLRKLCFTKIKTINK
jgi:hypothetical protein